MHQYKIWKPSGATIKDTRTTSRRCSGGFIANPKRALHTASVLHSSSPNRQMLEMLASCKESEIYPKLIEKNYSTPQETWLQLLDKQLWETLITIHETNNMSQTIQTKHIKVTCWKLGEKTLMQRSKCCTTEVF